MSLDLTERQTQILAGYSAGLTKAEVGRWLFVTEDTVKTHLRVIAEHIAGGNVRRAVAVGIASGELHDIVVPEHVKRVCKQVRRRPSVPDDVGERYPSTKWGVSEWFEMLKLDEQLFNSILRGIGKASSSCRSCSSSDAPAPRAH